MPELPEVETVRRTLLDRVRGRTIVGLRVGEFVGVVGPLGPEATSAAIVDRRIVDLARRGKYLRFDLDDDGALLVHLRMTGTLQLAAGNDPPLRFEHLAIALSNGQDLRFADQRKFGRVHLATPAEIARLDARLGPEPLEPSFTADVLRERLARRSGRLKSVLLDQAVVAGLGNIYVDEALFRAGLHPERAANDLTWEERERLHREIVNVLKEALQNRGTSFSSFLDGYGASGSNQDALRVYGRGRRGDPCPRCGAPLTVLVVGGRSSHVCVSCQPLHGRCE